MGRFGLMDESPTQPRNRSARYCEGSHHGLKAKPVPLNSPTLCIACRNWQRAKQSGFEARMRATRKRQADAREKGELPADTGAWVVSRTVKIVETKERAEA